MNFYAIWPLIIALLHPGYFSYLKPYSFTSIRVSPKVYTKVLSPVVGNGKYPALWHVDQWGIVDELSTTPVWLTPKKWQLSNGQGTIRSTANGDLIRLTLDSSDPRFGCGEFDLNLEPNAEVVYPGYPVGVTLLEQNPTLDISSSLRFGALQSVESVFQGTRCPEGQNLATMMMALTFRNIINGQTLFYQVVTYDSRGAQFNGTWFAAGPSDFGVSDSIDIFSQSPLKASDGPQFYDLEVLPRVKTLISNGPAGLDTNLSRWKVKDLYLSANVNGEAKIDSKHGYIFLVGQ